MAGQVWSVSTEGGYLANPKLSKELRHASQPMVRARQFVRVESGMGKNQGESLDFNKVSNIQTAGGAIAETTKMPESKFLIKQSSLVVNEFGNSIFWGAN